MNKLHKIKNIELANKRLLGEGPDPGPLGAFDAESYQETNNNGYDRLAEYLQPLVDQGVLDRDIADDILDLAKKYADEKCRECARGGVKLGHTGPL